MENIHYYIRYKVRNLSMIFVFTFFVFCLKNICNQKKTFEKFQQQKNETYNGG